MIQCGNLSLQLVIIAYVEDNLIDPWVVDESQFCDGRIGTVGLVTLGDPKRLMIGTNPGVRLGTCMDRGCLGVANIWMVSGRPRLVCTQNRILSVHGLYLFLSWPYKCEKMGQPLTSSSAVFG
ncbi:hypothetical protein PanWU01x14_016550 [Parasponia andersonii]|uniref:Uncharacterized protein n=1 Tax=Parasponia andersonii TaxID=3476 RepID=A0A2P5DZT7_PARAD|nr:hypothetical protein PanWU01x14_016550 [Parasponia andersonii]